MGLAKGHMHFGNTTPFLQPLCFHLSIKSAPCLDLLCACVIWYVNCELLVVNNNTLQ